jgi:hypothetical protein
VVASPLEALSIPRVLFGLQAGGESGSGVVRASLTAAGST